MHVHTNSKNTCILTELTHCANYCTHVCALTSTYTPAHISKHILVRTLTSTVSALTMHSTYMVMPWECWQTHSRPSFTCTCAQEHSTLATYQHTQPQAHSCPHAHRTRERVSICTHTNTGAPTQYIQTHAGTQSRVSQPGEGEVSEGEGRGAHSAGRDGGPGQL